ncbi:uncharacterized protein LOC143222299 [Tachypleus tridentatus]|uniref:uncharacterized protein LOC143222299 n=1 Tax=Tachypleus tridentatus TaxID=6853 RepID=UPI003FD42AC1
MNKEGQIEESKTPSSNEPHGDPAEDGNRASNETGEDCPDILKNPGLSNIVNCESPKREYNTIFMNSGSLQRTASSTVGTCNVLYPASTTTTKSSQVHAGKEYTVQSGDIALHTSSKPQKYVVGKVGVHVV